MSRSFSARAAMLMACVAVLLGSASTPADAAWLREQWREYRSYPRLNEAYRLYRLERYDEALRLVEQVEKIAPDSVNAATLKFDICAKKPDIGCIKALGQLWQYRRPDMALGPAVLAYVAHVEARPADMSRLIERALSLPGLEPEERNRASRGWMTSLIQLGLVTEAKSALAWLDAHDVAVASSDRRAWETAIASMPTRPVIASPASVAAPVAVTVTAKAPASVAAASVAASPDRPRAPAAGQGADTAEAPAQPGESTQELDVQPRSPVSAAAPKLTQKAKPAEVIHRRTGTPVLRPPPPPLPLPPPSLPSAVSPEAELLALIDAQQFTQAVNRIQELQSIGQLDALTREGIVLTLQREDCGSVLELVVPDASAPLTTPLQHMAAGYCAANDAELAQMHFAIAYALANGTDQKLAAQALAAQAHAQAALGRADVAQAGLAQAVALAPDDAQIQAAYGYQLKAGGQEAQAREAFERALQLDPSRTELTAELALLAQRGNDPGASIGWGRSAIDNQASIASRLALDEQESARRLFGWRRAVQTEEDRFGWYFNSNIRLDEGPRGYEAVSPVDYAQYGGSLNAGASYRYTPFGALTPTWAFARVSQGLDDRSLSFTPDNQLVGAGVRQRLSKDYLLIASAEYLWRKSAVHEDDVMLRLSGSHTWGGDWNPVDKSWTYANVYGDLAWLVRQQSHYVTAIGDLGRAFTLPTESFKGAVMPYLTTGYFANNDGPARVEVTRFDVGMGVALLSWHWEDAHRAPAIGQRLALEYRRTIAGNATDKDTLQLKWTIQH